MPDLTKKDIAQERIQRLFELATSVVHGNEKLAQRYVAIARRVAMASRVGIPKEYRRQLCRRCKKFILPGVKCRVRIQQRREPHIVLTCGFCGYTTRIPLRKRGEK